MWLDIRKNLRSIWSIVVNRGGCRLKMKNVFEDNFFLLFVGSMSYCKNFSFSMFFPIKKKKKLKKNIFI